MKFSTRVHIEILSKFVNEGDQVTSFYFTTDKSRMTRKEIMANLKNILNEGETRIPAMNISRENKEALLQDLAGISAYFRDKTTSIGSQGVAIFSASRSGFRQEFELPHGPRNRLVFDVNFYLRPLAAILDRYPKICVLLLGRRQAAWYTAFMGELNLVGKLESDVPAKVREGGYAGYEAKRIERHIDALLREHFKKVARKTFEVFKKDSYDWLLIGCDDNLLTDFLSNSHTYIKDKFKSQLRVRPTDSQNKILKAVEEVESRLKKEEEKEIVKKLVSELESGGRAVSGLRETLDSINKFEVQALVVSHNFSKPGFVCLEHKFLYFDREQCPVCGKKNKPVVDVVDEAVETVLKRNGTVRHINPPSRLDHYGHIGAFLKYKS